MKAQRLYLTFIIIFIAFLPAIAQDIVLSELPTQKQLPMAHIYRAFQDSEGYMWYGTEGGGLCRDDGYSISVFRSDYHTPHLLESNWITCITEDNEHRIWFGTKRGLYVLNKQNYQITTLKDKDIVSWAIDAILAASDSTIWVSAGNQILHYNTNGEKLDSYPIRWKEEPRSVSQIYEDTFSNIWIIQWKGGLFKFDYKKNTFTSYPLPFKESPTGIMQDSISNRYWISIWEKGIIAFNPDKGSPEEMFVTNPFFNAPDYSRRNILGMLRDTIRNYLWTITSDNLYAYKISESNQLLPVHNLKFLLPEKKIVNQIISDKRGNIWVPSYYPHTFILSFPKNKVARYVVPQIEMNYGHPASPVAFIVDNGHFWFGQRRSGLYSYNPVQKNLSSIPDFKAKKLSPLLEKSRKGKGFYTVVNDTVVMLLKYENDKIIATEKIVNLPYNDRIHTLHEDVSSNLWIGTSNNLFRYNLKSRTLGNPARNFGTINDITAPANGNIFLATEKKGLCLMKPNETILSYGNNEDFSTITKAADQTIWVGTQQGNVYYFDHNSNNIVAITKECGLNGDAVLGIETDDSGQIWILTDQRIILYNPIDKSTNLIYNSDPSISMNNFLSLYKNEEGTIFIGGTGGFCAFPSYKGLNGIGQEVPIKLSSIKVDGNPRLTGYAEDVITLQPNEQNVELFFSSLNHVNAKNVCYAFRYNQENEYWNYLPEGQNNVYLTGLTKGKIQLEVKATDGNGHWGNGSTKIQINRLPAWYETTLAYIIYILIFIASICLALHYYIERKKRILINEQIQNSAKDLQELVYQLSEDVFPTEGLNMKTLLISMQKILRRQKEEKENATTISLSDENSVSSIDEKFIQKALEYVEVNLDNSDYSVEQLSKDMGMDRTGLYRKLVSIIGKTPTSFIRSIRLKRAARLIEEGYTVSETADRVGFGTSSYLSKCFQEEFGVKPSQYIASLKQHKST